MNVGCIYLEFLSQSAERWNPYLEPRLAHVLSIIFLSFSLHLIDRQVSVLQLTIVSLIIRYL